VTDHKQAIIAAIIAAISLGLITTFATMAYQGGTNPVTLVFFRILIGAVGGLVFFAFTKSDRTLNTSHIPVILGTSIGLYILSLSYMVAVIYIPLSLAVIIFYTYPLILLMLDALKNQTWPRPMVLFGFALAFMGLALSLLPALNNLDWRGIVLAFLAAIGATTVFIFSAQGSRSIGTARLLAVSHFVVLPVSLITVITWNGFSFPSNNLGWVGLLIASVCYLSGVSFQFIAVRFGNPARMAMIFNLEPLVTLMVAAALLGERLNTVQYTGAFLVVLAILMTTAKTQDEQIN